MITFKSIVIIGFYSNYYHFLLESLQALFWLSLFLIIIQFRWLSPNLDDHHHFIFNSPYNSYHSSLSCFCDCHPHCFSNYHYFFNNHYFHHYSYHYYHFLLIITILLTMQNKLLHFSNFIIIIIISFTIISLSSKIIGFSSNYYIFHFYQLS